MIRPTASSMERVLRCPGHMALPLVHTTSPAAERGTAIHAYLEAVGGGADPEEALADVHDDWRPICSLIDFTRLPKGLAAEVAFAYDIVKGTARELGRGLGRKYEGLGPYEIAGTADIVGVSEDAVYVADFKTGWGDVPPAAENIQLRTLALMAARVFDRDRAIVSIRRIKENGSSWGDQAELDEFDLDAFAAELKPLRVRIAEAQEQAAKRGGVPDVSVGHWCRHCPAWSSCPANQALIARVASGAEFDSWEARKPLSPAAAGEAWERVKVIKSLLRRVEDSVLAARHEYGELPLPSGKVLREVIEPGNEQLDGRVVFAVAKELLGDDVAEQAIEIDASKAQLARALKVAAKEGIIPARSAAKKEREVLDEVRRRGGAQRPMRTKLVEVDVEPAQAPAADAGSLPPAASEDPPAPAPKEDKELADVRERIEHVFEAKDPDGEMHLIRHTIKMGMEADIERWAPMLKLWGQANEELKARAAKGAA